MWATVLADPYFFVILAGTVALGLGMAAPLFGLSYLQGTLGKDPRDIGNRVYGKS